MSNTLLTDTDAKEWESLLRNWLQAIKEKGLEKEKQSLKDEIERNINQLRERKTLSEAQLEILLFNLERLKEFTGTLGLSPQGAADPWEELAAAVPKLKQIDKLTLRQVQAVCGKSTAINAKQKQ